MVAAGLEPLVVFWTGWGIHFMVLVSFTVQVTLLLLADIRRRKDWAWLKVVIWSAYMLADTTAIYALGHMSVLCNWSPEHHLMAVWAPLLLVHLGGQDNITAYAIEDNRLWLRHLQTFVVQVAAAVYVLYVSSILSHPSSKVSLAAMLMSVVGVLKYGERIWALKRANSCASSSLSATSYDNKVSSVSRTAAESNLARASKWWNEELIDAYLLLDVPKQMFEGPTTYVQINNKVVRHEAEYMLRVVELQLWMMYDLLYTKAAVVHTWYGLCSRVLISLPFTVAALALFRSSSLAAYKRADVAVTTVLLIGAVVLETMSVLRAIFSKWTAVLLYGKGWNIIGNMVFPVIVVITRAKQRPAGRRGAYWPGRMRQHSFFQLTCHSNYSRASKMAKRIGMEDWWDSNVYSWSTEVPELAIAKVLELVSTTEDITKSQGLNALRRRMNIEHLAVWIWTGEELKLEERILVWHIATHAYRWWYQHHATTSYDVSMWTEGKATNSLANYMFFLLAARPYMLPYPVSRRAYVQLCSDAVTHFRRYCHEGTLLEAILNQKEALMEGTPLQPDKGIRRRRRQGNGGGTAAQPQPQPQPQPSMNSILDRACQLAAKLIHITATPPKEKKNESTTVIKTSWKKQRQEREERVDGNKDMVITEQTQTFSVDGEVVLNKLEYKVVLNMVLEVWVEMLFYTAYLCNENYHAKHLTDGGDIMTIITLLMIYVKNGLVRQDTSTSGTAAGPSSSQ